MRLTVVNNLGVIVYQQIIPPTLSDLEVDVRRLSAGVYTIFLTNAQGNVAERRSVRFVKQ